MKPRTFTQTELAAYLDEGLPPEMMAAIELELRARPELLTQLAAINGRRDAGQHALGDIWRRHRLTCPPRHELGSYLLGVLPAAQGRYVAFHLDDVGCPLCRASVADLRQQHSDVPEQSQRRQQRIFQSSAGHLRRT